MTFIEGFVHKPGTKAYKVLYLTPEGTRFWYVRAASKEQALAVADHYNVDIIAILEVTN